jgi:hypothetical protein
LVSGVLAGCGGESTSRGENTGASGGTGGSGSGATGAMGSGAVGGTISTGGGAIGPGGAGGTSAGPGGVGKGGGAGSSGKGGSSGAAGKGGGGAIGVGGMVAIDPCSLPPEPGPCEAAFPRFYFDAAQGECLPFTYGGCEGNANNFETLDECYAECGGPVSETMRCEIAMDCTVVPTVCCLCGEVARADLLAARRDSAEEILQSNCGAIGCECEAAAPPWAGATCIQGRCVVVDVRETEYTECSLSTDCVLRRGLDCCENCASDGSDVIAVRKDRDIGALTCGALVDCAACSTELLPAYDAVCREGRCSVDTTFL